MQTTHSRYRFWLILVVMVALAAACSAQKPALPLPQAPQSLGAPAMPGIAKGMAQLLILPSPDGVQVIVDGEVRGTSPLTLTLPAGEHRIALSAAGFTPYSETLTLEAGREATYAPDLDDVEVAGRQDRRSTRFRCRGRERRTCAPSPPTMPACSTSNWRWKIKRWPRPREAN